MDDCKIPLCRLVFMSNYFIIPVTKSPHKGGRVGSVYLQDWYQGVKKAVGLLKKIPNSKILIVSDVHIDGEEHEADIYVRALRGLGVRGEDMIVVKDCYETIGQIDIIKRMAKEHKARLIFVSTFMHYPRVRWLTTGMKAKHYVAFGIPRPREAVTDVSPTSAKL